MPAGRPWIRASRHFPHRDGRGRPRRLRNSPGEPAVRVEGHRGRRPSLRRASLPRCYAPFAMSEWRHLRRTPVADMQVIGRLRRAHLAPGCSPWRPQTAHGAAARVTDGGGRAEMWRAISALLICAPGRLVDEVAASAQNWPIGASCIDCRSRPGAIGTAAHQVGWSAERDRLHAQLRSEPVRKTTLGWNSERPEGDMRDLTTGRALRCSHAGFVPNGSMSGEPLRGLLGRFACGDGRNQSVRSQPGLPHHSEGLPGGC